MFSFTSSYPFLQHSFAYISLPYHNSHLQPSPSPSHQSVLLSPPHLSCCLTQFLLLNIAIIFPNSSELRPSLPLLLTILSSSPFHSFSPLAYPTQYSAVPPNLLIICSPFSLHLLSSTPFSPPANHNMIIFLIYFYPSLHLPFTLLYTFLRNHHNSVQNSLKIVIHELLTIGDFCRVLLIQPKNLQ